MPAWRHPLANQVLGRRFLDQNARLAEALDAFAPPTLGGLRLTPEFGQILEAPPGYATGVHRHHCFELSFVTAGRVEYQCGVRPVPVAAGECFLMPPQTLHRWHIAAHNSVFLGFQLTAEPTAPSRAGSIETPSWLVAVAHATGYHFSPASEAVQLFELLMRETAGDHPFHATVGAAYLGALLAATLRPLFDQAAKLRAPPTEPSGDRHARLYRQACAYIGANLGSRIQAADVARYVGVTPRHLNRIFLRQGGATVGAHLQDKRLARATHLLRESADPIKTIAAACGYATPAYFCRVFKTATGDTPGRIRTAHAGQPQGTGIVMRQRPPGAETP